MKDLRSFKTCADKHNQILFDSNECPVCAIRLELDEILDAKTDIEQADIFDLYDELKVIARRVHRLEKHTGVPPLRQYWWRHNKETSQASPEPMPDLPEADF